MNCGMCVEPIEDDSYVEVRVVVPSNTEIHKFCSLECAHRFFRGEAVNGEEDEF